MKITINVECTPEEARRYKRICSHAPRVVGTLGPFRACRGDEGLITLSDRGRFGQASLRNGPVVFFVVLLATVGGTTGG